MSKNPLFRNGEKNEKVIRNADADTDHQQKLASSRGSSLVHAPAKFGRYGISLPSH